MRYVHYWMSSGALQHESDAPLSPTLAEWQAPPSSAQDLNGAARQAWAADLAETVAPYAPGAVWDPATRSFLAPASTAALAIRITPRAALGRLGIALIARIKQSQVDLSSPQSAQLAFTLQAAQQLFDSTEAQGRGFDVADADWILQADLFLQLGWIDVPQHAAIVAAGTPAEAL